MKTNNKKAIKTRFCFYAFVITISLSAIMLNFFIKFKAVNFYFVPAVSIILILIALRNLFRFKYFDYEHSGEVLTIKYYSAFTFGKILPALEIPKQKICSFSIEKKGKTDILNLVTEAMNGKNKKFSFRLKGLSIEQTGKIRNSLSVQ